MPYNPAFDVDLKYGQMAELWLSTLGTDKLKVEVKAERDKWQESGNAVFEYECRGQPSGIATTKADWWLHTFWDGEQCKMAILMPVPTLKEFLRNAFRGDLGFALAPGGDDGMSKLILVKIRGLHCVAFHTKLPL